MAAGETEENNIVLGPVARGGFPARSLTSRLPDSSSGEWLLAYQAEQTKYLKAMFASVRNAFQRNLVMGNKIDSVDVGKQIKTEPILDKAFILKHCYVENPSDLYVCNISSCGLSKSIPEELLEFHAVEEVIANDNKLSFDIFAFFPSLQELELSINHIRDINFDQSHFINLQILNLSYNALSDSAILLLGILPSLKELHLTGNDIVALPIEMSRALVETNENGSSILQMRYTCLEKLWLDDNKLTDLSTFAILAGLRRLKMLNLDNNEIYSIPQLKLLGADSLQKTTRLAAANSQAPLIKEQSSTQSIGSNVSGSAVDVDELNAVALRGTLKPSQVSVSQLQFNLSPFPCLETLSMANNMIMTAEGLVAVSGWPSLNTVIIHGNPITRLNKGLPPLLKSELVDPFGIKIMRQVPNQPCKPKVAKKASDFVKVSDQRPPAIPKQPLLAIEQSHSLLEEESTSHYDSSATLVLPDMRTYPHTPVDSVVLGEGSPQDRRPSTVGTSERTDVLLQAVVPLEQKPKKRLPLAIAYKADPTASGNVSQSPHNDDVLEDSGVFITQVKDDGAHSPKSHPHDESGSPVMSVEEEFGRNLKRIKNKWRNIPDKFKGFEALLESDSEGEDDTSPSDIARCTRALKHALDHPLLLNDCSKPNLNGRQYLRRKSKSQVPQTKALPHKVKEIQQVLHSIKSSCNTLEANLSDVLESEPNKKLPENTKKLKKESKDLLKEIQSKYTNVRRKSLITISEVATIFK